MRERERERERERTNMCFTCAGKLTKCLFSSGYVADLHRPYYQAPLSQNSISSFVSVKHVWAASDTRECLSTVYALGLVMAAHRSVAALCVVFCLFSLLLHFMR